MNEPAAWCPACYERVPDDRARACDRCGTVYHTACLETAPCVVVGCEKRPAVVPAPPPKKRTRWRKLLFELALVLTILGVLSAMAVPNFGTNRERLNTRACYANQKTIAGAMEMYNLDKNTKRTQLDAAWFTALHSGGYLQTLPQDPGQGGGTSANYQATDTGSGIKCITHGTIR